MNLRRKKSFLLNNELQENFNSLYSNINKKKYRGEKKSNKFRNKDSFSQENEEVNLLINKNSKHDVDVNKHKLRNTVTKN